MNVRASASASPWIFFMLVLALSVPLWLVGPTADQLLQ